MKNYDIMSVDISELIQISHSFLRHISSLCVICLSVIVCVCLICGFSLSLLKLFRWYMEIKYKENEITQKMIGYVYVGIEIPKTH